LEGRSAAERGYIASSRVAEIVLRLSDSHDRSHAGLAVVLAARPVDFRGGHDALAGLVQNMLGLDPQSGLIVVSRSKRSDRLKLMAS
jgi:transposase